MIEVLFLGVGSAIPMPGQTNSSFVLRVDDTRILIDCGPAILQQLAAVGMSPSALTHVYFTHRHGDHSLGYAMLMLWWSIFAPAGAPLPVIIASAITFRTLDVLMKSAFGAELATKAAEAPHVVLPDTDTTTQVTPAIRLRTIPLRHHEFAPVLGARFEVDGKVLTFTGDTMPTDNVIKLARDADLLVHDSTYSATLNPEHAEGAFGHSTALNAALHAKLANVKHLALVHIDSIYEGKVPILIEEAERKFSGRVSAPVAGTLYTF